MLSDIRGIYPGMAAMYVHTYVYSVQMCLFTSGTIEIMAGRRVCLLSSLHK